MRLYPRTPRKFLFTTIVRLAANFSLATQYSIMASLRQSRLFCNSRFLSVFVRRVLVFLFFLAFGNLGGVIDVSYATTLTEPQIEAIFKMGGKVAKLNHEVERIKQKLDNSHLSEEQRKFYEKRVRKLEAKIKEKEAMIQLSSEDGKNLFEKSRKQQSLWLEYLDARADKSSTQDLLDSLQIRSGDAWNEVKALIESLQDAAKKKKSASGKPSGQTEEKTASEATSQKTSSAQAPIQESGPWQLGLAGGFGQMEVTRFGIGTVFKGGKEVSLAKNHHRVNVHYVHSHLSYSLGPLWKFSDAQVYVGGRYQRGKEKDTTREPIGGNTVALTYDRNSSLGFTGIGPLNGIGAKARSENRVKSLDLNVGITGDLFLGDGFTVSPNVNVSYKGVWQQGWGDFKTIAFGDDISSETDQDLDDHYYGLGTGAYLTKSFEDNGLSVFVGGEITGYYRETDLDSEQENRCTVGGCTADNNFTATVEDDNSGITYGAVGRVGFTFNFADDWHIGALGTIEYLQERGGIVNRENPAQSTKRIRTDDALDWNLGGFLRRNF